MSSLARDGLNGGGARFHELLGLLDAQRLKIGQRRIAGGRPEPPIEGALR